MFKITEGCDLSGVNLIPTKFCHTCDVRSKQLTASIGISVVGSISTMVGREVWGGTNNACECVGTTLGQQLQAFLQHEGEFWKTDQIDSIKGSYQLGWRGGRKRLVG